jgi:hypothetical protein
VSAPIATLKRLARVRERLRDVAAAAAAKCESAESAARTAQEAARAEEEAELDRSPAGTKSVNALVERGDALAAAKANVAAALETVAARKAVSRQAAAELNVRERSLRGVERLLQAAKGERRERVRREEQKLADDLSSGRKR